MGHLEIRSWIEPGKVLFAGEADDLRGLVIAAVAARANLACADLAGANLVCANLAGANLAGANLACADLAGANLVCANLAGANLARADLVCADLAGANLARADLAGANLAGANLAGANNADLVIARTVITPEGTLIGWKQCRHGVIVKLRIPEEARRSSASGRKCRAEFVDVLEVIGAEVGISMHDSITEYRTGQRVAADKWCEDRWQECAGGIHFYLCRIEAENH